MEAYPTLDQITAAVRHVIRQELAKLATSNKRLSEIWATEAEALQLCGKSKKTLYRAIESGKIKAVDVRPNPIAKGYLIRRTALIGED